MDYGNYYSKKKTPQTVKVKGVKKQKRNNAGGVSFKISKWNYMLRFLILGTEGGTYYVNEGKYTRNACKNVDKCIKANGKKAVDLIVSVSTAGRSANNDAAIFALALAASCNNPDTRKYALANLSSVCRIGTHLFHFIDYVKKQRGFGRGLREGIAHWYTTKSVDKLAYQMLKYQGRDGWTHRDVLRLCHAQPVNKKMNKLFAYAVGKRKTIPKVSDYTKGARKLRPDDKCANHSVASVCSIITKYKLTREVIPNEWFRHPEVWEAMLPSMPYGALVRNLGKMASLGMHKMFSETLKMTVSKLKNKESITKSRIHPLQIINAIITYRNGCGLRGSLFWEVNADILKALEFAFYESFENVEPTGKRIMLALDVSGSMTAKLNNSLMSCREATAILAMVTMRVEPFTGIVGFTSNGMGTMEGTGSSPWGSASISELPLNSNMSLNEIVKNVSNLPFSGTDCSLPFIYCQKKNIDVDAIVTYTDNETWAGAMHPWQALDKYQDHVGHEVKSIVVGMTATEFSIARPEYLNMLDVVGFDTNTPATISEFIR